MGLFKENKKIFINFLKQMNMIQKVFAFIFLFSFAYFVFAITDTPCCPLGEDFIYVNGASIICIICIVGYFFFKDYN